MMSAAGIAHQLEGYRQGSNWRVLCPRNCGYSLSLRDGKDGRLLAFCFGGCDFNEIMLALVEYGLLDGDEGDPGAPLGDRIARDRDDARRRRSIQQARSICDSGGSDERIAVYLRSRGITWIPPILKFHEQAPHRIGARFPAMLAPIVDVEGEQIGVHMTYLRRDGGGKADLPKEFQRECRGALAGGVIRLMEHDPGVELIIAEGIETSLLRGTQLFDPALLGGGLRRRVEDS